jgi:hypothetical protein
MAAIVSSSPRANITYEGPVDAQGRYNGDGILTVRNTTYEGEFRHGQATAGKWVITSKTFRYSGDARRPEDSAYPRFHGSGTLKDLSCKSVYIGQFSNGNKSGAGTLVTSEGVIEGRWLDDLLLVNDKDKESAALGSTVSSAPLTGYGSIVTKNGSSYDGDFVNGVRQGNGVYVDAVSSVRYDGQWNNDVRHGKGRLFGGKGRLLYDGEWRQDKQTQGKCFDPVEKWSYEGELYQGQFHGQGQFQDSSGNTYVGAWSRGKRSGHGCEKNKSSGLNQNGSIGTTVYVGQWLDGAREGEGEELRSDGSMWKGSWKQNVRHGMGTETWNGDTREGQWCQGRPVFGEGVEWLLVYSNSEKYVGECAEKFQPECKSGTFKYASGDVYKGGWRDGVRHGRGVMYHSSGDVEEDEWVDGVTKSLMALLS